MLGLSQSQHMILDATWSIERAPWWSPASHIYNLIAIAAVNPKITYVTPKVALRGSIWLPPSTYHSYWRLFLNADTPIWDSQRHLKGVTLRRPPRLSISRTRNKLGCYSSKIFLLRPNMDRSCPCWEICTMRSLAFSVPIYQYSSTYVT